MKKAHWHSRSLGFILPICPSQPVPHPPSPHLGLQSHAVLPVGLQDHLIVHLQPMQAMRPKGNRVGTWAAQRYIVQTKEEKLLFRGRKQGKQAGPNQGCVCATMPGYCSQSCSHCSVMHLPHPWPQAHCDVPGCQCCRALHPSGTAVSSPALAPEACSTG